MKNITFLALIPIILFAISCQPTKIVADTSCPGYKSMDFHRNDISNGGIGIMPVLGGGEKEEYRRPMGEEITRYMRYEFGTTKVKSPRQVISILNDAGLASDYASAISLYNTSGIIPQDLLSQIGKVLGVNYLMYVKLLAESDVDYSGETKGYSSTVFELYLQTQVWSTKLGDVVWEGKGGYAVYQNAKVDLIKKSAEGISKVIGNERGNGPCESTNQITKSIEQANVKTIFAILGGSAALGVFLGLVLASIMAY